MQSRGGGGGRAGWGGLPRLGAAKPGGASAPASQAHPLPPIQKKPIPERGLAPALGVPLNLKGNILHICVCIKQTPDSTSVYIDPVTGQVDTERFVQVLNPADACAVEAAVRIKEQIGAAVKVLTFGPIDANGALRAALAIGAGSALRLWNPQAAEWGPFTVAVALASCLLHETSIPDLILCGDTASDWSSGIVGP